MEAPTPEQAQAALGSVEHARRQVVDHVAVPAWYWVFVAGGWVLTGAAAQYGNGWVALVVTLGFGAVHSTVASRVVDGRHPGGGLVVDRRVVGRQVSVLVISGLLAMVVLTVVAALALDADGARHPSLAASLIVAVVVLAGGPALPALARRRLARQPRW